MVRGAPDYSRASDELGRLLAIRSAADIFLEDDFNTAPLKWFVNSGTGTLNTTFDINQEVFEGASSLQLSSDVGGTGDILRDIGLPPKITNLGMSLFFHFSTEADWSSADGDGIAWSITHQRADEQIVVTVRFNPNSGKLFIEKDLPVTRELLATVDLANGSWHFLKLVYNLETQKYVRVVLNDVEYDVSAFDLSIDSVTDEQKTSYAMSITAAATKTAKLGVDRFRILFNEA